MSMIPLGYGLSLGTPLTLQETQATVVLVFNKHSMYFII